MISELAGLVEQARAESGESRPFKKIYNFHLSVAHDRKAARDWAKRNTSYGVSGTFIRYPEVLDKLELDREAIAYVADAYTQGLGINEAGRRVSDDLLRDAGAVFAGTPDDVIEPLREMIELLDSLGFDHYVFGVPLGPDVPEALELIGKQVIPAVVR
jgi:alkanesulfonate monooxygenase SsuD/methylene tetrahydromethanopterin reductase-like flavin-dependent oxidoreductase (luciferase family)